MAVPTGYTQKTLAEYMHNIVKSSVRDTGWTTGNPVIPTDGGSYTEPINDVLLQMGLTDVTQISSERILETRLRSRAAIWLAVTEEKVPLYNAGGAQRTLSRSQVFDHAYRMLGRAEGRLSIWLREQELAGVGGMATSGVAYVRTVWGTDDPYNPND